MYFCYIDESGSSVVPGNTSHFVLAGLSIPIAEWKACDQEIARIKVKYDLEHGELHVAWMLRKYLEQSRIPDFQALSSSQRRMRVESLRKAELFRLQKATKISLYHQTKKNYRQTESYIHLTYEERKQCISDVAACVAGWGFARLFAECIDKVFFDPARSGIAVDEQAFEQVVSRFEKYLQIVGTGQRQPPLGLLIHDNNPTVAQKHTRLMREFHGKGTLYTKLTQIIETPLFVDSQLTSMVQIADLCAYALRRYLENGESELFDIVFVRADRKDGVAVGVRHYTNRGCSCKICASHRRTI